jgi:prevent-host-death family protein
MSIAVEVRDFQNDLSDYLRRVEQGETVVVTREGTPVGRLVPANGGEEAGAASGDDLTSEEIQRRMQALQEAGIVKWSGEKPDFQGPVAKVRGEKTVAQMLLEDRR